MTQKSKTTYLVIEDTKSASYIPSHFYAKWLPVSIPLDMGVAFIVLVIVLNILPLSFLGGMYRYIFLPGVLTFLIFKVKVNYQPIWFYIPKKLHHFFFHRQTLLNGSFETESRDEFDFYSTPVTIYWQGYKLQKAKKRRSKRKEKSDETKDTN